MISCIDSNENTPINIIKCDHGTKRFIADIADIYLY